MAHTTQKEKIVYYLQDEYLKTGANDPVAWRPIAAKRCTFAATGF